MHCWSEIRAAQVINQWSLAGQGTQAVCLTQFLKEAKKQVIAAQAFMLLETLESIPSIFMVEHDWKDKILALKFRWGGAVESKSLGLPVASLEGREELALQFAGWLACSYSTATPEFLFSFLDLFHWAGAIQLQHHFLIFFFGAIPLGWSYSTATPKFFISFLGLFHWVGAFPLRRIQI